MTHRSVETLRAPASLVIGVTGHRDLRPGDLDDLKAKVREIFRELREKYPSTPFLLLSSLAEGADRLVARVALEPRNRTRLVAPLPMPLQTYELDFNSASSLEEFRMLLGQADHSFEIALPESVTGESLAKPGPARDHQYELQGRYLARESQILIALWDGVDSGKVGGTSEVVKFQTLGLPHKFDGDLAPPELFPVYRIVTPRASNPAPIGTPFSSEQIYPPIFDNDLEKAERYYVAAFTNLDDFNRLAAEGGEKLASEANQSKKHLTGDFDEVTLSPNEVLMLGRYANADALAMRYQKKLLWRQVALHIAVFLSYVGFVSASEFPKRGWLRMSPLIFLIAAVLIYLLAKRAKLDNRSQDYRALAEGCRVRFFWSVAGLHESVRDHYLGEQRTELDWIRNGLRGWEIDLEAGWPGVWTNSRERMLFVVDRWIDSQIEYFEGAEKSNHKLANRLGRLRESVCAGRDFRRGPPVGRGVLLARVALAEKAVP